MGSRAALRSMKASARANSSERKDPSDMTRHYRWLAAAPTSATRPMVTSESGATIVSVSQAPPVRYRSGDEDSGRWLDFPFRQGDIVISARSKGRKTWMQMTCVLLVFQ